MQSIIAHNSDLITINSDLFDNDIESDAFNENILYYQNKQSEMKNCKFISSKMKKKRNKFSENWIFSDVEENFIEDVEEVINDILRVKVSQEKLEPFLKTLLAMTSKQSKLLLKKYSTTSKSKSNKKQRSCNINIF